MVLSLDAFVRLSLTISKNNLLREIPPNGHEWAFMAIVY